MRLGPAGFWYKGRLAINFVTEGYLYTVLKEFSKIYTQPVQASATGQAGAQIASLVQQSQQITNAMQGALSPSATASYQAQLNIISQQIQSLAAQGGPDAINAAKIQPRPRATLQTRLCWTSRSTFTAN